MTNIKKIIFVYDHSKKEFHFGVGEYFDGGTGVTHLELATQNGMELDPNDEVNSILYVNDSSYVVTINGSHFAPPPQVLMDAIQAKYPWIERTLLRISSYNPEAEQIQEVTSCWYD
jgi:hypothetical protein